MKRTLELVLFQSYLIAGIRLKGLICAKDIYYHLYCCRCIYTAAHGKEPLYLFLKSPLYIAVFAPFRTKQKARGRIISCRVLY